MIVAFLYKQYYMWNCKDNFRGVYDDIDQAKELLRGDRHEYHFLETMDLETFEFKQFEWKQYYDLKKLTDDQRDQYEDQLKELEKDLWIYPDKTISHILVEKYPGREKEPDIEFFHYTYLTTNCNHQAMIKYQAGYWKKI